MKNKLQTTVGQMRLLIEKAIELQPGDQIIVGPFSDNKDRQSKRQVLYNERRKLASKVPILAEKIAISRLTVDNKLLLKVYKKENPEINACILTKEGKLQELPELSDGIATEQLSEALKEND